MIYIISENTDIITDNVESWLLNGGVNYKRINDIFFYKLSLVSDKTF